MHIPIDEHHLRENIARSLLEGVKPPESTELFPFRVALAGEVSAHV
jgi:hypothetical protein